MMNVPMPLRRYIFNTVVESVADAGAVQLTP